MSKDIEKWADEAMFKAEPLKASDGPKVFMLAGTPDPLGAVAAMSKMYKGEVVRNFADVTDDERRDYLQQILKTKLKAPLEAVKVHFMVEGVTRSFTHQMVRQRTAVYAQESLRFAVKEDMADGVALPPSIAHVNRLDVELPSDHEWDRFSNEERMRVLWDEAVEYIGQRYNMLINMGMPAEDARGLLPHNITTRLNYVTDLRALQDHAGNRLCTQAQFEWRMVWVKIIEAMRDYCTSGCDREDLTTHDGDLIKQTTFHEFCDNWQWKAIADIFRPVCYLTGKCEFRADFDRKCSIRPRVDANHEIGRPSSEWDEQYEKDGASGDHGDCGPGYCKSKSGEPVLIGAIQPAEWLLDPAAAR